jgi:hypothetical protein
VDKFVEEVKESGKRRDVNGKKPAQAKASPNGKVNKAAPKISSPKGQSAPKKSAKPKVVQKTPLTKRKKKK